MKADHDLFDTRDAQAEAQADARADANASAGRTVSHGAVKRWLASWGSAKRLPRPRIGD
jgi:predicted transcriptional regulator